MKTNSSLYIAVISVTVRLIGWIHKKPVGRLLHWWYNFLDWHFHRQRKRKRRMTQNTSRDYIFQPFKVHLIDYKSYLNKIGFGRGINFIPKPRSGHRLTASATDLFCFGGKSDNIFPIAKFHINFRFIYTGYNPDTESHVFPELLKFNVLTQRWCKVYIQETANMPKESVSNAIAMRKDLLVVRIYEIILFSMK